MNSATAVSAVDDAISELINFDLNVAEIASDAPPSTYVQRHRHEYMRTVRDILAAVPLSSPKRVLELGSFFGVVCMALKSLGYEVVASDVPEYIEMPEQKLRYGRHGIETKALRLEDYIMPFADAEFDAVIMCEVLEHLNFNPLPLLKEINRVLKPGAVFYLSLPNGANINNRKSVVRGLPIGSMVSAFFSQLDPSSSAISYGHWREYTGPEVRSMLEPLGFRIERQYYFSLGETQPAASWKKKLARRIYETVPTLKENQTTIAIREKRTDIQFRIPATVHPTLRTI